MKILMVCLGNICRSPLAEGIMREKILVHNLDWEVDSAGTSAWHVGNPPDNRSIWIAKKNNIDISKQIARQFSVKDLEAFDIIYAMDYANLENITKLSSSLVLNKKVKLILSAVAPTESSLDIPDPYWNDDGFKQVFHLLNEACERIIQNKLL